MNSSVRLLVVSPPCIEPVNRAVYGVLATDFNVEVHLAIPSHRRIGNELKTGRRVEGEPFTTTALKPVGSHLRLQRLQGLSSLIQEWKPTHVLVDTDAASFLMRDVLRPARKLGARVWAVTCENIERHYLREGMDGFRRGSLRAGAGGLITWLLWRSTMPRVDHVFTISSEGTRVIRGLGFGGRVTQIPLGFDPRAFYPQDPDRVTATRRRLGLYTKTIAYFGRLAPEKGVHVLLASLAKLTELSWQFLIDRFSAYATPYEAELRDQIESLGIGDRVVYFDAAHSEMPDYMNAADFVVLPSVSSAKFKEQYGRVLPEAMACGKVVLGSQSGSIPELIADAGILFPEGDVDALANQLRSLLTAPEAELDVTRTRARKAATEKLSIFRQAHTLANKLYEEGQQGLAPSTEQCDAFRARENTKSDSVANTTCAESQE